MRDRIDATTRASRISALVIARRSYSRYDLLQIAREICQLTGYACRFVAMLADLSITRTEPRASGSHIPKYGRVPHAFGGPGIVRQVDEPMHLHCVQVRLNLAND